MSLPQDEGAAPFRLPESELPNVTTSETFDPARLRLARELNEWSQAELARAAGLTPAAVSQFESGQTRPGRDTVNVMAHELAVPEAFFAAALTETHEGFFRSLRRSSVSQRRRARALAHLAHDVAMVAPPAAFPQVTVPHFPVDLNASPETIEQIAAHVRADWKMPPGRVDNVVELLETHGVVVIRLPLDSADVDAFSLPFAEHPVVVLGTDKNDKARSRFDAAHELGHLVMHGDQVWGLKEIEDQAHQFAAAFLMPATDIRDRLPPRADWPRLFQLKSEWQVSLAALLYRAKTLGKMSPSNYLTAIKASSARGWRRSEPVPLGPPEVPRNLRAYLGTKAADDATAHLPKGVVQSLVAAVGDQ
jgi:Zn-dependent peptidase ImmA (M78 family)/transcriptional regulator with XRE-family HTH domain